MNFTAITVSLDQTSHLSCEDWDDYVAFMETIVFDSFPVARPLEMQRR